MRQVTTKDGAVANSTSLYHLPGENDMSRCVLGVLTSIIYIPVKIMRLKEFGPKLRFRHLIWDIIDVFLPDRRVGFEYRVYDILCKVVLQAVTSVRLGLDVG